MNIVIAEESKADALANIVKSTFHLACPKNSNTDLQFSYISKHLSANNFKQFICSSEHVVLVVLENEEPLGLAVIEKVTDSLATLSKLYVLPRCHGKGVAGCLFDKVMEHVEKLGYKKINLSVYSGNSKAKAFYEKKGFKLVGACDFVMETEVHKDHLYEKSVIQ